MKLTNYFTNNTGGGRWLLLNNKDLASSWLNSKQHGYADGRHTRLVFYKPSGVRIFDGSFLHDTPQPLPLVIAVRAFIANDTLTIPLLLTLLNSAATRRSLLEALS